MNWSSSTADGAYLWVVSPGRGSEAPVTASQELWLIDVATFSIVDRRRIGMFVDGCQPVRCPDGHMVGLSLWVEGRPAIGWVVAECGRIDLSLSPWRDRVLTDVHPAGLGARVPRRAAPAPTDLTAGIGSRAS
jgi:hypothetical protein